MAAKILLALLTLGASASAVAGAAIEPGQSPYQSRAGASCSLNYSVKYCTVRFAPVPSGQRLVATYVACNSPIWPSGSFYYASSFLYESFTTPPSAINAANIALPAPYIAYLGPLSISAPVQAYFTSLNTPSYELDVTPAASNSVGSVNLSCQLTGYLVAP